MRPARYLSQAHCWYCEAGEGVGRDADVFQRMTDNTTQNNRFTTVAYLQPRAAGQHFFFAVHDSILHTFDVILSHDRERILVFLDVSLSHTPRTTTILASLCVSSSFLGRLPRQLRFPSSHTCRLANFYIGMVLLNRVLDRNDAFVIMLVPIHPPRVVGGGGGGTRKARVANALRA